MLKGCPENSERLLEEMRHLPLGFVPWHFMVSCAQERKLHARMGYTVCETVPAGSYCQFNRYVCIASPELVFLQLAKKLSIVQLIKLGDELCGTYMPVVDGQGKALKRKAVLTNVKQLEAFLRLARGMNGVKNARRALAFLVDGSASVKETELEMTACLPMRLGGYSMRKAFMNYRVDFDETAKQIADRSYARCDLCWPDVKLDVEYDSREHHDGYESVASDKARANALRHMGYEVVFVTSEQFANMRKCDALMHDIAKTIGHRIRDRKFEVPPKRIELHRELLASSSHPVFKTRQMGHEEF